jgi:hypothetical protein
VKICLLCIRRYGFDTNPKLHEIEEELKTMLKNTEIKTTKNEKTTSIHEEIKKEGNK